MRIHRLGAVLLVTAAVSSACASGADTSTPRPAGDAPSIVAAFYPLAFAAEQVGGHQAEVTSLTPPGVEPHDLELSAAQVGQIADADIVLYIKGFQPAVDEAVEQQAGDRAIDVSADLDHLQDDPHVWLNPMNMAAIGDIVAERLSQLEPTATDEIVDNNTALSASMTALDAQIADGLASCESRELVVSHEAFGYLAAAYDLTQIGIAGLSPEAEPSPARMRDVAALLSARGITTVYSEPLIDPRVAETVADESGANVAVLDPIEGLAVDADGDYVSVMTQNLATLVAGQRCT